MKKLILGVSAAGLAAYLAMAGLAGAQGVPDLGVENVGLLPSNPFYFLKEFGRGVKKLLTTNAIKKAEFELNVLNEKAAEAKKLEEIAPHNVGGLVAAVNNYKEAAERLGQRLEALNVTSKNPNVEKLINQLVDRSLKHQELFNELQSKFVAEQRVTDALSDVSDRIAETLSAVPGHLDDPSLFRARFGALVADQKDEFRELRAAELADRLEEKLSGEAREAASGLKEDLLIAFSGRLEGLELSGAADVAAIGELPGDRLRILRLLDEVREITSNPDLRNSLNIIRQRILDKVAEEQGIGPEAVDEAIAAAKELIAEVEAKISSREGGVRSSVRELVNRAKFNLEQAEKFYQEENYGGAYGQATAAYATAKNAWNQLVPSVFDHSQTLESLKAVYDRLAARVREAGLTKEEHPKIFELLAEAERRIVELNKLLERGASPETVAAAIKTIKLLLATLEELIRFATNPPASSEPAPSLETAPANADIIPAIAAGAEISDSVTVVVGEAGFSPGVMKVKQGTRVNWFNRDLRPHWPASDLHPTHQLLPGFDSQQGLSQGETYSFVFEKPGSWKYHDHLNPGLTGVVEVVE